MASFVDPRKQLVVEIYVRDIKRSTEFYRQLGFQLQRDDGNFVVLVWEGFELYLDERKDLPPLPSEDSRANFRVMVPNVDDCWQRALDMNAHVVSPIADRDYGLRVFMVADPDGFGVRFATPLNSTT